jgi:hypothetical protein
MLELSCHCGQVHVHLEKPPPYVNECNCTLCRKTGALWGYFHPSQVRVEGTGSGYSRADRDDPGALIHFCAKCGCTTHFTLTPSAVAKHGNTLMGVNMRLAEESELPGVEVRYPDGRAWNGEGEIRYLREARVLGS